MLTKFFVSPLRIEKLVDCPSGPWIEGFALELSRAGYAEITARRHIRGAEHFLYWGRQQGVAVEDLDESAVLGFDRHFRKCRCPGFGVAFRRDMVRGARLFLGHLGPGIDHVCKGAPPPIATDPALLIAFCRWMRVRRGIADATISNYCMPIRQMLKCLGEDPGEYDAQGLRRFVLEHSRQSGWAATKRCTTAVRMFIRFLVADGQCGAELEHAVPIVAHWRLSALPRYLPSKDVERVIAACPDDSPMGLRDRAIVLLLARLGLRAGDVWKLRLGDIDWKQATVVVTGKSRRETRLPLTREVGQAVLDYLKRGRPSQASSDIVFVRTRAPFRGFRSHAAISVVVANAMRRAGVKCQLRGAAHVLRHSMATAMLREGASLEDIATVLRHRSIATTQVYAKVDVKALRKIVQSWPESRPC